MKLTDEWFKEKENFFHYIDLIPDMLKDIVEEAQIRWCCNYEEFQIGFKPIREQILDDYEKARKWEQYEKSTDKVKFMPTPNTPEPETPQPRKNQNQKLRELIESDIEAISNYPKSERDKIIFDCLTSLLEESKK